MGSSMIHGFLPLNGEIKHSDGILFLPAMQSHSLPSLEFMLYVCPCYLFNNCLPCEKQALAHEVLSALN